MISNYLELSEEVKAAIHEKKPIVALESTIISHGMPYPRNVETANLVEQVVRNEGAIPATIAIRNGKCLVGLNSNDLEFFGNESNVWKVSLRDMPYVLSQNLAGATTVAATMRIASLVGISIFATGGIGGVHRGAETTMDISTDLTEMSNTNVAVVSAGVKSILDIGLTLEYLETLGVPVITFKQKEFPSFYSAKSGFHSPLTMDDAHQIANLLKCKWELGLGGSVLIANPISLLHEVDSSLIEIHIQNALSAAKEKGIVGKSVTPFILKFIAENTNGESLDANIELIKSNAKLAAEIALNFSKN
jgi:pseudouridine-5'-phosphate glycosidase